MKKIGTLIVMFALASLLLTPQLAVALQVTTVDYYGPWQTNQGGEFTLSPNFGIGGAGYLAGTTSNLVAGSVNFQSFCLEENEYIYPNTTHYAVLNSGAVNGGVGGQTSPGFDPISIGTAYLYHQFQIGQLPGYDYANTGIGGRHASADLLQQAIWGLEGEVQYDAANPFIILAAGQYVNPTANNNGVIPVGVLNLYLDRGLTQNAQDMLVCLPVPEPASMLLLGLGLVGLAGIRRFKK